jgi:Carboxypeptidase regulatory-like domain
MTLLARASHICGVLLAGATLILGAGGAAPATLIRIPVHAPVAINPHLHGATLIKPHLAKAEPAPAKPTEAKSTEAKATLKRQHEAALHHPWIAGWDAAAWRDAHLRYGSVRGTVTDAAGHPLRNAHVWLRKPGGAAFAVRWRKHATDTDAAGHFLMTHVIAQEYRLCTFGRGEAAKLQDRIQISVKPSSCATAHLDLH